MRDRLRARPAHARIPIWSHQRTRCAFPPIRARSVPEEPRTFDTSAGSDFVAQTAGELLREPVCGPGVRTVSSRLPAKSLWYENAQKVQGVRPTFQIAVFKTTFLSSSPPTPATESVSS